MQPFLTNWKFQDLLCSKSIEVTSPIHTASRPWGTLFRLSAEVNLVCWWGFTSNRGWKLKLSPKPNQTKTKITTTTKTKNKTSLSNKQNHTQTRNQTNKQTTTTNKPNKQKNKNIRSPGLVVKTGHRLLFQTQHFQGWIYLTIKDWGLAVLRGRTRAPYMPMS